MPRTFPTPKPGKTVETAAIPDGAHTNKFLGTIFEVDEIDGSGSMHGLKFDNAVRGVDNNMRSALGQSKITGIKTKYCICQFSGSWMTSTKGNVFNEDINAFTSYKAQCLNGSTALYRSTIEIIKEVLAVKKPDDKVLMRIFTDGGETDHPMLRDECAALIAKVQKHDNFTITFVGTATDVARVQHTLNIDATNTLVHDNTGKGVAEAFAKTMDASVMYRSAVSMGQDVSMNFYSKSL